MTKMEKMEEMKNLYIYNVLFLWWCVTKYTYYIHTFNRVNGIFKMKVK